MGGRYCVLSEHTVAVDHMTGMSAWWTLIWDKIVFKFVQLLKLSEQRL